jgi:hypothetical protein
MEEAKKFITIGEAVESALNEWAEQETSIDDMEMLADEFVQRALSDWEDAAEGELPLTVSNADAETIQGAVTNALAEWHASGTAFWQMASMAEELAQSTFEDWKSRRDLDADAPSA